MLQMLTGIFLALQFLSLSVGFLKMKPTLQPKNISTSNYTLNG